ncbi:MAG TPA: TldD/PmbA family protein [Acidimicrobiales bacterium]|nr:TldD/PmbA family protein [Acidimicrobiales bacterium]
MTAGGDDVCDRVLARVGDAGEATVRLESSRRSLTRFANSFIHQNVTDDAVSVRLSLVVDGRPAVSTTTACDDAALDRLVERTLAAARLRPVDPHWPGLAPPVELDAPEHWDEATATAPPEARAEVVAAFVAAAGMEAAGFCSTTGTRVELANSAGLRLAGRFTRAELNGVARDGTADGSAAQVSAAIGDLDGATGGRQAGATARSAAEAVELAPATYEVVLAPACVASIVDYLAYFGFNAKMHAEGLSFARLDEDQFDPGISLWDDAADRRTVGLPFDEEGTPRRRVDLVRGGRTSGLLYDRRTAGRQGTASTGHGSGDDSFGPLASNVFLGGGDRSPADLVASVGRGLLVNDLWYLTPLDRKSMVVSGLTRNGVFLVEDGRLAGPVRNLRFTQSFVEALGPGRVLGIGDDARLTAGGISSMAGLAHHVPSLHLAGWAFSGGASG